MRTEFLKKIWPQHRPGGAFFYFWNSDIKKKYGPTPKSHPFFYYWKSDIKKKIGLDGDEFAGPAARFFIIGEEESLQNLARFFKITWPERREPRYLKKNVASAKSWRSYNGRIL